jgi:hypothetical protein
MIRRSQISYMVEVCSSISISMLCFLYLRQRASQDASASGTRGSQDPCAHCMFNRTWRASSALAQMARISTMKRTRNLRRLRGNPVPCTSSSGTAVYWPLLEDASPFGSRRPRASSTVARVVRQTMAQYMGLSSANDEGTVEVKEMVPNTRPLR